MKKHPRFSNGQKASREDFNAGFALAGRADDYARASLNKIVAEGVHRRGYAQAWRDGPIVVPSGSANGAVQVQPFWGIASPNDATNDGGMESASDGAGGAISVLDDQIAAFYAGGTSSISVPLSGAGKMRWDLLYAIVSTTDSDSANRLKKGAGNVIAQELVNTRTKPNVSLAWVQGAEVNTGAGHYPTAPALPTPAAGQAHVPLAFVQVQHAVSMATAEYTADHIANCAPTPRLNPQTGATVAIVAGVSGKAEASAPAAGAGLRGDALSIITAPTNAGGWPLTGSNIRPQRFVEPGAGEVVVWVPIGPFSAGVVSKTFPSGGAVTLLDQPITVPDSAELRQDAHPFDLRNRWFFAELIGHGSSEFAHALAGSNRTVPGEYGNDVMHSAGNSFYNFAGLAGYTLAAIFIDPFSLKGKIYLLVNNTTGRLHLAGANDQTGEGDQINKLVGVIRLVCSPRFMPIAAHNG